MSNDVNRIQKLRLFGTVAMPFVLVAGTIGMGIATLQSYFEMSKSNHAAIEARKSSDKMALKMSDAFADAGLREAQGFISKIEHQTELTRNLRDGEIGLEEAKTKRKYMEATDQQEKNE